MTQNTYGLKCLEDFNNKQSAPHKTIVLESGNEITFHDACDSIVEIGDNIKALQRLLDHFKDMPTQEFKTFYKHGRTHYFNHKGEPVDYPTQYAMPPLKNKTQVYAALKAKIKKRKYDLEIMEGIRNFLQ